MFRTSKTPTAIVACLLFVGWTAAHALAGDADAPSHDVTLTLPWDGTTYKVPPPAVIDDEMRASKDYRLWKLMGDHRTFSWTKPDGHRYVADGAGWVINLQHQPVPLIPSVRCYRADGTLEVETLNAKDGPMEWTLYAADGQTKQVHVRNRLNGLPGTPFIEYVDFYGPGATVRQYHANLHGVVFYEWLLAANGEPLRLLHGGNQYVDATTQPTTQP